MAASKIEHMIILSLLSVLILTILNYYSLTIKYLFTGIATDKSLVITIIYLIFVIIYLGYFVFTTSPEIREDVIPISTSKKDKKDKKDPFATGSTQTVNLDTNDYSKKLKKDLDEALNEKLSLKKELNKKESILKESFVMKEEETNKLKKEIDSLQTEVNELKKLNVGNTKELDIKKKEVTSLKNDNTMLKEKISSLESEIKKSDGNSKKLKEAEELIAKSKSQLNTLNSELKTIKEKKEKKEVEFQELSASVTLYQDMIKKLEMQVGDLSKRTKDYDILVRKSSELEKNNKELMVNAGELKIIRDKYETLEYENEELKSQVNTLTAENANIEYYSKINEKSLKRIDMLQSDLDSKNVAIKKLHEQQEYFMSLQSQLSRVRDLEEEVEELRSLQTSFKSASKDLERQRKMNSTFVSMLEQKYETYEDPAIVEFRKVNEWLSGELESVKDENKELESKFKTINFVNKQLRRKLLGEIIEDGTETN